MKVQLAILSRITEGQHLQQVIQTMIIIRIIVLCCTKVHGGTIDVVIPILTVDIIMVLMIMEVTMVSRGMTGRELIILLKTAQWK